MRLKIKRINNNIGTILCLLISIFLFQACNKEHKSTSPTDGSTLDITVTASDETEYTERNNNFEKEASQYTTIKTDDSSMIEVALHPINKRNTSISKTSDSPDFTVGSQENLKPGIKYDLYIYDEDGKYVLKKSYKYGQGSTDTGIQLDAGKTYTVIALSTNSPTEVPSVKNQEELSKANAGFVFHDLLYFKKTMKMKYGKNHMNIVLKHQKSEITTKVLLDPYAADPITRITGSTYKLSHPSANLHFNNGKMSYNGQQDVGKSLTFEIPVGGIREATSKAVFINYPETNNQILSFGQIHIGKEIITGSEIKNLKVIPGHRYSMEVLLKRCYTEPLKAKEIEWNHPLAYEGGKQGIKINGKLIENGQELSRAFEAGRTPHAFIFDIYELDNSFNLKINGTLISTEEIQFQKSNYPYLVQNIGFKDGGRYGQNGIPNIYDLKGDDKHPILKVVVKQLKGEVLLYGCKEKNGPLYPLELLNNKKFQQVKINAVSTSLNNKIVFSQKINGTTVINASGVSKVRAQCK